MCKCDFCYYRYDCIGFFPDSEGGCAGFVCSSSLQSQYEEFLESKCSYV